MRRIAAVAAGLALLAAGCATSPGAGQVPKRDAASAAQRAAFGLRLTFSELRTGIGGTAEPITNSGSWQVRIKTLSAAGGAVRTARGRGGRGLAVRFPAAGSSQPAPAAVIRVDRVNDRGPQPGNRRFRIGADFQLDSDSSRGAHDNGDNIVQRGLWGDPAQYKIQVDHGRPSCLIRGQAGQVYVQADTTVNRTDWYRVTCERRATSVVLRLVHFHPDGTRTSDRWRAQGRTGRLRLNGTWISVGGKVTARGKLVRNASDQFNGRLDNVFVAVLD